MTVNVYVNVQRSCDTWAFNHKIAIKNVASARKFSKKCQGFGGTATSAIIMYADSVKDIKGMFAPFRIFLNISS